MPDPSRLRDSTQIVLRREELDGLKEDLDAEFTVTITTQEGYVRIIGSPVEIKEASKYLSRHGITLP